MGKNINMQSIHILHIVDTDKGALCVYLPAVFANKIYLQNLC